MKNKILISLIIIGLMVGFTANAQFSSFWKLVSGALTTVNSTWHIVVGGTGTSTFTDSVSIGSGTADVVDMGTGAASDLFITDDLEVDGAITCGGGGTMGASGDRITKIWATDVDTTTITIGSASSGEIDMQNNLILNIGHASTDFVAGGGLNIHDILDVDGDTTLDTTTIDGLLTVNGNTAFGAVAATSTITGGLNVDANTLFVDPYDDRVGIGTATPSALLDVNGNFILSGGSRYVNFNTTVGSSGYGFREDAGTMQYKDSGDNWTAISAGGGAVREVYWAEENSTLASDADEWAFGNGRDSISGLAMAYSGTIKAVSLSCDTAGAGVTKVIIEKNNVDTDAYIELAANVATGYRACNVSFSAGDTLDPHTVTAGSAVYCRVAWWVEYAASAGGTGDITAVGSVTSGDAFSDTGADNQWLGLGAAAGRIEFDNQTTDEVNILAANVGIGTQTPTVRLNVQNAVDTSTLVTIQNTDTAIGTAGYLLELIHDANNDTDADFLICQDDGAGTPDTVFSIASDGTLVSGAGGTSTFTDSLSIGGLSAGTVDMGAGNLADLFVSDDLEVEGTIYADGGITGTLTGSSSNVSCAECLIIGTEVKAGTLTDTKYCVWDTANTQIVCNSTPAGSGDLLADGSVPMTADFNLDGNNLDNSGVIFLKEQADADADIAGQGQIWVNTATPNELWWTDDAGTDTQLGAAGSVPTQITVADESADTTCFMGFFTAATGDLEPKTGTNVTFNSNTGILTASGFTGNVTGDCTGSSGSCTGESATVATITGLAPDTATTQATQAAITSLGTLTALQVDNLNLNLNTISSTAGTDLLITPLAGQQIILDGTIIIDAGAVTGATSITSTAFVGNITGDVTGNCSGSSGTCSGLAATATALAGNGANCAAGSAPLGVDASGAVESCFDVWTETENTAAAYTSNAGTVTNVFDCSTGDCNTLTVGTSEWLTYGTGFIDANRFAGVTTVDGTEFGYLNGVTSAIQTQFTGKQATLTNSAGLRGALNDETGTGVAVFGTAPSFTTSITTPAVLTGNVALTIGDAATDSITFVADGTGNAEFTFPADVIGDADIDWGAGAGQVSGADITFAEGDMTDNTIVSADIKADTITHADILDSDQTDTKCIWFEDPVAADDFKSIWANKTANNFLFTEIWGESDQNVSFDLQVDDGTPADVSGTDINPNAGEAEDTTLAGDTTLAAGEELDLIITSVSGTPTWVSICWTGNWVD